jgi:hypothetical protein
MLATSAHTYWEIGLAIGLAAALIAAALLAILVRTVDQIDDAAGELLGAAGEVAAQTSYIPQLNATAPVLGKIVEEALVQDDYMNALTDGFGGK